MKKDAYYFPHDANARNDEKMLFIRSQYGIGGYAIYFMLVETMHESYDGKLTCNLINGFAFSNNIDIDMLERFYNDAISIGLFVSDGTKYWSDRVLRNKLEFEEKRFKKSEAGKRGMASRWANNNDVITKDNSVITNDNKCITEDNKGKESKVKESKNIYCEAVKLTEKQYKELITSFGEAGANDRIENLSLYIRSKGDSYKCHYSTILSWERKHKKEQPTPIKLKRDSCPDLSDYDPYKL